jgi:hypothetical protein
MHTQWPCPYPIEVSVRRQQRDTSYCPELVRPIGHRLMKPQNGSTSPTAYPETNGIQCSITLYTFLERRQLRLSGCYDNIRCCRDGGNRLWCHHKSNTLIRAAEMVKLIEYYVFTIIGCRRSLSMFIKHVHLELRYLVPLSWLRCFLVPLSL